MGRGHLVHLDTALLVRIAFDSDLLPLGWVVGGMGRLGLGPHLQNPDPKAGFAAPFVSVSVALTRGAHQGRPIGLLGRLMKAAANGISGSLSFPQDKTTTLSRGQAFVSARAVSQTWWSGSYFGHWKIGRSAKRKTKQPSKRSHPHLGVPVSTFPCLEGRPLHSRGDLAVRPCSPPLPSEGCAVGRRWPVIRSLTS